MLLAVEDAVDDVEKGGEEKGSHKGEQGETWERIDNNSKRDHALGIRRN